MDATVKRNIKLTIEYDGSGYFGWQSQNGHHATIQETVLKAIQKATGEKPILYGASRTDTGVHAFGQVANFSSQTKLPPERLRAAINAYLPRDIIIRRAEQAPDKFNAQFQAKSKTYCYTVINGATSSALQRNFAYYSKDSGLDIKAMMKAARYLKGKHDFGAFGSPSERNRRYHNIRTIYSISVKEATTMFNGLSIRDIYGRENRIIQIMVKGNGFLYNMVRTIAGTLLLAGKGKISPEDIKKILKSRDRNKAGPTMPAHGLCLLKIEY
ncbi:MAG: tRNA pseudouridine(38-40) synthase TruA [Planctomycetes bacterium]|nr:tRNA pseudouridine(38-40) synthase TruA [Planctomycetota bacterium]